MARAPVHPGRAGRRFNEAHARRRGKSGRDGSALRTWASFNEAHARRRGKWRQQSVTLKLYPASMRPTPEGVGNKLATRFGLSRGAVLQ